MHCKREAVIDLAPGIVVPVRPHAINRAPIISSKKKTDRRVVKLDAVESLMEPLFNSFLTLACGQITSASARPCHLQQRRDSCPDIETRSRQHEDRTPIGFDFLLLARFLSGCCRLRRFRANPCYHFGRKTMAVRGPLRRTGGSFVMGSSGSVVAINVRDFVADDKGQFAVRQALFGQPPGYEHITAWIRAGVRYRGVGHQHRIAGRVVPNAFHPAGHRFDPVRSCACRQQRKCLRGRGTYFAWCRRR